jgi:hypothetical protein
MSPADAVRVRHMIDAIEAARRFAAGRDRSHSTPTRCCCSPWSAQWRSSAKRLQSYVGRRGTGETAPPAAGGGETLLADGKPAPPWFGLARKHMRKVEDHGMEAIRESIGRGWAQEVAEGEAALRKTAKR